MTGDRVALDEPAPCCVCGHLTPRGQVIDGLSKPRTGRPDRIVVGWCDLDWQRYVVRWAREAAPLREVSGR